MEQIRLKCNMYVRIFFALLMLLLVRKSAQALPWDVDMYSQESLQSNEVARAPAKGTVAVGRKPFTMTKEEADQKLQNPRAATRHSVWNGQRLYNVNCLTCHGRKADGKGPVGPQVAASDLTNDLYVKKSDGYIYAVIHLGGAAMPRYGYKFSEQDHWDVINYLRVLQKVKNVPGIKIPE